jgi:integrase
MHETPSSHTAGVAAVLRAAEHSRYHTALALIVATGLRKGEALGLRWDGDINLDEGWLKVRQTLGRVDRKLVLTEPKTEVKSRGVVYEVVV